MTRRWKIVFSQSHNLLYQVIDVFRQMLFLTYEEMKADLPKVKLPFSSEIFQHWIYLRIQFLGDPKGCWLSGQKPDCWRGAWKQFFYEFNPHNVCKLKNISLFVHTISESLSGDNLGRSPFLQKHEEQCCGEQRGGMFWMFEMFWMSSLETLFDECKMQNLVWKTTWNWFWFLK